VFSALLDTCVLVPSHLRDVLLETANRGVYRALWSEQILTELERTVRTLRTQRGSDGQETEVYIERLLRQMRTAFPDAAVEGWQPLIETFNLPDPNDRHVVAAAFAGRADVLVTQNLKDFPPDRLGPQLQVQDSDTFLLDALDLNRNETLAALRAVAFRTGRTGPALTALEILGRISEAPAFAATAAAALAESNDN
jgi:predicted nucleic acid-binding protein